jgi:hypothetical protein
MESAKNIYSLTDDVLREGPLPQENCSEIIDALIERFYEHPDRQQAKSTLIRAIESLNEYGYQDMWAEALKVHNRLLPPVRNECAMILLCSLHDIADINTHLAIRISATTYRLCLPDSPGEDVARRCLIEFTCHKARLDGSTAQALDMASQNLRGPNMTDERYKAVMSELLPALNRACPSRQMRPC